MTIYIYEKSGRAVGFINGRFIHDMNGRAIGQLNGSHVHKLRGKYVGELENQMVVDKHLRDVEDIGYPGTPITLGSPGNPLNRGENEHSENEDVFKRLLGRR